MRSSDVAMFKILSLKKNTLEPCCVIIADDHELVIDGLLNALAGREAYKVVGIAVDGVALKELVAAVEADLLLVDISMPRMDGLEAIRQIRPSYPHLKIIVVSTYPDLHMMRRAREYGANGYYQKGTDKKLLFECAEKVLQGKSNFPDIDIDVVSDFSKTHPLVLRHRLSRREWEILILIGQEYTNKEIAAQLHISENTVETHRKNIMHKLGLKNPAALIKFIMTHHIQ